jgi:hypothetical protein
MSWLVISTENYPSNSLATHQTKQTPMSPCQSCIHFRVTHGSLHPIEKWCAISGELISANDVWNANPTAYTSVWNVRTEDVPECKFTMSLREVREHGVWLASKMTLFYRKYRGSCKGFFTDKRNDYWLEQYNEERQVERENYLKRFWS